MEVSLNLLNKYNVLKLECINMFNKTKHCEVITALDRE